MVGKWQVVGRDEGQMVKERKKEAEVVDDDEVVLKKKESKLQQ